MLYLQILKIVKISDSHRPLLKLSDKIDVKRKDKDVALSNFSIYCTCKNIKNSCKNNKFKIPGLTWNEKSELPDGSYSVSDIEYIIKKMNQWLIIFQ